MTLMEVKVLSPLHIGNGNTLTPLDIYPSEGVIYVLDTMKLMHDLTKLGVNLEEVLQLLKNPPENAYIWKSYIDRFRLNLSNYSVYSLKIHGEIGKTSMQIKEFIKVNGKPYIPGSSVKGALRTAVLYKVLKDYGDSETAMKVVSKFSYNLAKKIGQNTSLIEFYLKYLQEEIRKAKSFRNYGFDTRKADDLVEAIVFGMESSRGHSVRHEPKRSPFKALIVRDSSEIGKKHLAIYRVDVIGNPQPIPIWVEALEPETITEIEVSLDKEALRLGSKHFNGLFWECLRFNGHPWEVFEEFLWEAVEEFYNDVIKEELKEAGKFGEHGASVKKFYSSILSHKGHLLRLGWGSGWLSTTIGILLKKVPKWESLRRELRLGKNPRGKGFSRDFPKTRRIADGLPMGWVVMK